MTALLAIAGLALLVAAAAAFGLWFGGPLFALGSGLAVAGVECTHLARVNGA